MPKSVRTRFAPSPTGYLHLGGLRTALYNYLFARRHRGAFVLRLEDTDRSRFVEGAAEKLMNSLKWAGLKYDEGPDISGPNGPYIQSERLEIYQKYARQLLEQGDAFRCFCTAEDLEKMRRRQEEKGEPTRYDGTCRRLSASEVQAKLDTGLSPVVRLKMPESGETTFADIVRGEVTFQNNLMDDQVLLKSDGYPTYHLANVVDDHLMEITHIIRGEEWLPSVPKHLQIYKVLGWEPPKMAHLSLLLNPDRSKLSKRQGDVAVEDYAAKGYLPEALVNYVALLGWNPGTDEEIFPMIEMVESFELERVSKSGAVFDVEKLRWMNGQYLREMMPEKQVAFLTPFLAAAGADVSDAQKTAQIVEVTASRIEVGEEAFSVAALFYSDKLTVEEEEAMALLKEETAPVVLQALQEKFAELDQLDKDNFKAAMKAIQKESGVKGPALWKPVRVALTGQLSGPDVASVAGIFGKEKSISFLQQALKLAGK